MIKSKPCIVDWCNYPRFAKSYCKSHQHLRDDKEVSRVKLKKTIKKKKKTIKPVSDKRKTDNLKYKEVKAIKQEEYSTKGIWVCFFSNEPLEISSLTSWHHLHGKSGKLLYQKDNIEPVLDKYHMEYHHKDVDYLLNQPWYLKFLTRIEKSHPKLFAKEQRRIDKGFGKGSKK